MKRTLAESMFLLAVLCIFNGCGSFGTGSNSQTPVVNQYYVDAKHPNASDDNPGTEDKPWKTVVFAGKTLKAGDKLTIKPGIYYGRVKLENSGVEGKPIIIEGSSLGDVVISGDKAVKGWKRVKRNSRIWEASYTQKLHSWPPRNSKHSRFYVSSEPADLSMDGLPLFWSYDGECISGSWRVDKKAKRIYVRLPDDTDPNTHLMEVISDDYGIDIPPRHGKRGDYVIIRNLVIRRFGRGLRLYGKHIQIENNIVEWCAYVGIQVGSRTSNMVLKNTILQWNGNQGTNMSPKGKFINNRFLFNNWKLNSPGWDAAGLKGCAFGLEGTIEGNEAAYNGAMGIWLDIYPMNTVVRNNIAHDNANAGLENEISDKSIWSGNLSYRNKMGFFLYGSSNIIFRDNVIADNLIGIKYNFRRTRVPHDTKDMKLLQRFLKKYVDNYSKEEAYDWLQDFLTYHSPCSLFKNNLAEKNLLLNNGVDFSNSPPKQLEDPKEKWMISGNTFKDNVLVNSKTENMVEGYASFAQYQKKTKDGKKCLSFNKLDLAKFPDWGQTLYAKFAKKVKSYRSYLSVKHIYNDLGVRNGGWCGYSNSPTPAGLLALARICESEQLQEKKFSDPFLKAYFINYKNKQTLVLWRKHGRPADFVPVILKGIPENATLETSWGKSMPLKRKNDLVSINVGTWPLYIVGVGKNISELQPFSLKMPEKLEYGKQMELVLENHIGSGVVYIDKYMGIEQCPEKISVSGNKILLPVTLSEDARNGFVQFRIAGHFEGLYAGQMVRLFTGKSGQLADRILKEKGFAPVAIDAAANCRLDGDSPEESLMQMGVSSSLKNLPNQINLSNIPFVINKGSKACIGFNSTHVKGKARPDFVTIDLGGKKYKYLAFLQACAWAPKKLGIPLLKYSLNYVDNFSESTYVKNGINIMDWWRTMDENKKKILNSNNTWQGWSGNCGSGHDVQLYVYIWKNPKPDVGIKSLQISTADPDKKVLMGVVAVSALENKK